MIGYYPIEFALDTVIKDVYAGKLLHESLVEHAIFPKKLVSLISACPKTPNFQNFSSFFMLKIA